MERAINIPTGDGHVIYGTLNGSGKKALIIFVHGLTGHRNEHHFFNAARYFPKHGFATFRFDLYNGEKKARQFKNTTLTIHASDLDVVLRHFNRRFKRIFLVGHSMGGPTILLSQRKGVGGVVLWDPSSSQWLRKSAHSWLAFVPKLNAYVISWGTQTIMGKSFYKEMMALPNFVDMTRRLPIPYKIIFAGKGTLRKHWPMGDNSIVISGATHCFDEEGAEEALFKHTLTFLQKHA